MDMADYTRFILALLFVLGLIGLLAAVVRRFGLGMPQTPVRRGKDKRLSLVEVLPIDAKRRLMLFKRDDVEHLVIIGQTTETLVETITPPYDGDAQDFSAALEQVRDEDLATQTDAPA